MVRFGEILVSVPEADKYIKSVIEERIINMVSLHIASYKNEIDIMERNRVLDILFPDEYPEKDRLKKLEKMRETLVSRERSYLDSISKYVLFNMLTIHSLSLNEVQASTRFPFMYREYLDKLLMGKYDMSAVREKLIENYEDMDNYVSIIFDNINFLNIDELNQEELLKLELDEYLNN